MVAHVPKQTLSNLTSPAHRRDLPRGVYRVADGVYRARVKLGRQLYCLGRYSSPKEAAEAVEFWYRGVYGEGWEHAYRRRMAPPWTVVYRRELKVYQLSVWVMGIKTTVVPRKRDGFATRHEAREYFRRWLRESFGLFASVSLWRSD